MENGAYAVSISFSVLFMKFSSSTGLIMCAAASTSLTGQANAHCSPALRQARSAGASVADFQGGGAHLHGASVADADRWAHK